jgi:ABC-type uncharacterized transport system permease subunit
LERALAEAGARPKVFGPHFDRLVSVIYCMVMAALLFRFGLRHYESTGH